MTFLQQQILKALPSKKYCRHKKTKKFTFRKPNGRKGKGVMCTFCECQWLNGYGPGQHGHDGIKYPDEERISLTD